MKFLNQFSAFLAGEVNLSQPRLDQLDERVGAIDSFLRTGDDGIASRFVQTIPQGSYAHRTIINPVDDNDEFDADLLLELTEDPDWSAEDYVEELYKAFRASSRYRGMVSRHARCVKVDYANEFHVDVVPYVERHGEHYICNRDNDEFELTNPEGFNEWLDQQDQTTGGKLIKVIRLFKYLRDYKNTFSVKSVILNILVGGRVNSTLLLGDPGHYQDLPTAFKNLLADLNDYLQANPTMPNLTDPSCPSENFNHRCDQDAVQESPQVDQLLQRQGDGGVRGNGPGNQSQALARDLRRRLRRRIDHRHQGEHSAHWPRPEHRAVPGAGPQHSRSDRPTVSGDARRACTAPARLPYLRPPEARQRSRQVPED